MVELGSMEQFSHEVIISSYLGTHFDIGNQLGQKAKEKYGPNYVDEALDAIKDSLLYKWLGMEFRLTPHYIDDVFPVVEGIIKSVHPQLLEEVKGFAQGLGEDYIKFLVFTSNFGNERGCSEFFLNGYLSRNYDDAPKSVENEFLLLNPEGSFTSIGASTGYVERLDGINEKGLAASLTFGAGYPAKVHGIGAAMFLRIILDKASSIDDALAIIGKTSYVTPNNVMIADASGKAIVIEASAGKYRVRKAENTILACANSYAHPEMKDQQRLKNPTTVWRENKMQNAASDLTSESKMINFLTSDFPEGVYEPYFKDGLGTLWSVLYHPESRGIHIAIGEKDKGRQEISFSLTNPAFLTNLPVILKTELRNISLEARMSYFKS